MESDATLDLDGETATGITVPPETINALGAGKRPGAGHDQWTHLLHDDRVDEGPVSTLPPTTGRCGTGGSIQTEVRGGVTGILASVEQVAIRSAASGDVKRLVALLEHGALEARKEDPSEPNAYLLALSEIQATGESDVLVAVLDGEVVGMCQLIVLRHFQRRGGLCAELESMHVHPDFRGRGIGEQLLDAAVDAAQRAGCYRVQLTSDLQRTDAHRFYERHGFVASHVGFKQLRESP